MTNHVILPASMVKLLLIHMFHLPSIDADVKIWTYGNIPNYSDIDIYNQMVQEFKNVMPDFPILKIEACNVINESSSHNDDYIGINNIYGHSADVVRKNFKGKILPDDRVNIIATSTEWLAIALALKHEKILNHAARVISTLALNNAAVFENLDLLTKEFNNEIRIDIINEGRCSDILAVARTVEAMEPPEEPNGVYITNEPYSPLYLTDDELPTPITGRSIRIIYQLKNALANALTNGTFLKRTGNNDNLKSNNSIRNITRTLDLFEEYLKIISNRFRCNFQPRDISKELSKVNTEPVGLSSRHYIEVALKHILKFSMDGLTTVALGADFEDNQMCANQFEYDDFSNCINPFITIDKTLEAFKDINMRNLPLRSACIDIWEEVMNASLLPDFTETIITSDSSEWETVNFFDGAEIIRNQKVLYSFKTAKYGKIISSPLTGFAMSKTSAMPYSELGERDINLKRFIYDYVMNVPGFDSAFKEYVSNACSTTDIYNSEDSFFEKYPSLGQHIPIY